jgi:hypothetical protein
MKTEKHLRIHREDAKTPRKDFFLIHTLSLCLIGLLIPSMGLAMAGDSSYQVQAPLAVPQAGLVETILPPELHHYSPQGLDLRVLGPEGKSRACELYWMQGQTRGKGCSQGKIRKAFG